MCTREETKQIVQEENKKLFEQFLETTDKIINSVASRIQHTTAPDTDKRLKHLEMMSEENKSEHSAILDELKEHRRFHSENKEILEEIRNAKTTKKYINDTIKEYWLLFSLLLSIASLWIKSLFDK